ncbi:zinc finger protein 414 [Hippocampus comes]|uniref:zinc finger protein 414 n=1 Tax=Hippocampus comes TaxID=109280 RepID=UPI00094EBE96|nr:PREDICTED: zinc finger protein 414 [Hippocampus comes]
MRFHACALGRLRCFPFVVECEYIKTTMSSCSTTLQTFEGNGIEGNQNAPCPFHGCKRVYTDVSALESHMRDHAIPSESLPGKSFNCSTVGCSCSFPNMQKLMEHVRRHHKPNIYFLCENCRTKLRSYRGLLTHLHTCSKVPRGKMKSTEQMPLQPVGVTNPNATPLPADLNPPQMDVVSTPHLLIPQPESS